jgi:hypothetical protein
VAHPTKKHAVNDALVTMMTLTLEHSLGWSAYCFVSSSNTERRFSPPAINAAQLNGDNNQQGRHYVQTKKDQTGHDDSSGYHDNTGASEPDPTHQLSSP